MSIFKQLKQKGWNVSDENHGLLIAQDVFKKEMKALDNALSGFQLTTEEGLIVSGGQKAIPTGRLTELVEELGWLENTVEVENEISFSDSKQENVKSFFRHIKLIILGAGATKIINLLLKLSGIIKMNFLTGIL